MRYPPAGSTTPSNYGTTPQMDGVTTAAPRDLLINFLDNHDVPRFLAGDLTADPTFCPLGRVEQLERLHGRCSRKLYAALVYMYTEDGIRCLYYGTEQDFHGQNDPSNREVLWETATDYATNGDSANDFPTSGTTFQTIARLTRIRAAYTALRRGVFDIKWVTTRTATEEDAGMLAFERNDAMSGQIVLVVINAHTASMSHTAFNGTAMATDYPEGTQLTDVLATRLPAHVHRRCGRHRHGRAQSLGSRDPRAAEPSADPDAVSAAARTSPPSPLGSRDPSPSHGTDWHEERVPGWKEG